MKDLFKFNINTILLIVAIILMITISQCSNNKSDFDRINKGISALHDSIKVIKLKDGTKAYQDDIPQMTAKEIINSPEFQNLSQQQKNYYEELNKTKGLIASLRQEISIRDSIIKNLSYNNVTQDKPVITDSSICFRPGAKLNFVDSTSKYMRYDMNITLNKDSIKEKFKYQYSIVSKNTWTIDKKTRNILVTTTFDDPHAKLEKNDGLLIPYDEMGKNKLDKWNNKNRHWLKWVERGAIFLLGAKLGNTL